MNQPDHTQQTKRRYFVAYFASRQWHSKRRRPFHKRMTKDRPMQDVFPRHSLRLEISISNLFFVVVLINFPQRNLIYETSDATYIKHSQGHNNPKALSILTQSTHLDQSRSFERDMEELLLGSIFYCFQIGGKSRTTGSDQMAPIYTRQT